MKLTQFTIALLLALGLGLVAAPVSVGAALAPQDDASGEEGEGDEEGEESDEDEEEDKDRFLALVGGDVHNGLGGVLRGATLLTKNKKIHAIGYDVIVPDDAEVVDISGMRVYPGLIALRSSGLFGGGGDLRDSVDPYSQTMTLALAAGITTAVNGNTVAKLKRGHLEGLVVKNSAFENFSYRNNNPRGQLQVEESFAKAAKYLRAYRKWERDVKKDKELKAPSKRGIDDRVLKVLTGEIRPRFSADERHDLVELSQLAQKYGFRPIIDGAREGWAVADELGRAGATAIVTPRERRSADERRVIENGSTIENAAKLYSHGVNVAVVPQNSGIALDGIAGQSLLHLPTEVGFAIRGGLPEQAALESVTLQAARVLGLGHRLGSLEVGKDADMIITDGDVLHYQTFVQWAIVDGEIVYDKQEEMFFAHIRPRPESALAPEEQLDAGEENAEDPEEEPEGESEESSEEKKEDEDEGEGSGGGSAEPEAEVATGSAG